MKQKENSATSNAKMVERVHSTGEGAQKMQMQAHSLTTIPSDLHGEIARFLSVKELMRLMMTSKEFFNDSNLVKIMIRKINESFAIKQLAAGGWHTLALTQEGHVLAWGKNDDGQLGLGHHNNPNTPQWIEGLNNVAQLAAGCRHTLALTQEGHVFAWGENNYGQLGTRRNTWLGQLGLWNNNNQNTPGRIIGLNNVVQIVAGVYHTLALTQEGYVWAWGLNDKGQLGLGHNDDQNTPQWIEGLNNVVQLVAGYRHTLALTQEGRVLAWGLNHRGQLGLGHNNNQNTPGRIEGLNNVAQLVAGYWHTLALTQEGRVLAWGLNDTGLLGLGHHNNQNTPQWIEGLNNVVELVAGGFNTLALTQEGRVLAWGFNDDGQLGLGNNFSQNTPGRIEGLNNVAQLVAGFKHTLALTQEGRVWAWGFNHFVQLGLGHHNNQNTPHRVNIMPYSTQAFLQHLEHHCRKISKNKGGKAVYVGNGYDNGDAKESSLSCSTAASSAALFSSGHQSGASVTQGLRSTEVNHPNSTNL